VIQLGTDIVTGMKASAQMMVRGQDMVRIMIGIPAVGVMAAAERVSIHQMLQGIKMTQMIGLEILIAYMPGLGMMGISTLD